MAFVTLNNIPIQLADSTTSINMSSGSLEFFLAGSSTPTNLFSNNSGTSIGNSITLNAGGYPESGGNVITLFRDTSISYKIVCKDAAGNVIWTADNIEDGLAILSSTANAKGASLVSIEDVGLYFAGANVEAALQDIGADYLKKDVSKTGISATYTFSTGIIAMADSEIRRPTFVDYAIKHSAITSVSGVLTINLETANSFSTTLFENITTITITNPPTSGTFGQFTLEITQDGSGGAYTVAQPASVIKPGGTAPVISVGNDAIDDLTYRTRNGGTTWKLDFSQAYS